MSNHRQDAAVFDARVKHLLDSKPHNRIEERSRQEILEKAMLEKAVAHVLVQEEELRQRGSDANQIASELDNGKERANSDLQVRKGEVRALLREKIEGRLDPHDYENARWDVYYLECLRQEYFVRAEHWREVFTGEAHAPGLPTYQDALHDQVLMRSNTRRTTRRSLLTPTSPTEFSATGGPGGWEHFSIGRRSRPGRRAFSPYEPLSRY